MSVVVVGINHRTVDLDVLESMAVGVDELPKALHELRHLPHLSEVVVLSTCMRTEVYVETARFHAAVGDLRGFLSMWSGRPPEDFVGGCYEYYDEHAVEHLFRVTSGLESAVLGEGEILGQVRAAWDAAAAEGTVGPVLGTALRRAVETGKRVRSETAISRGTTSLSHTAVMLAASAVADAPPAGLTSSPDGAGAPCSGAAALRGRRALVLGAGQMGRAVATILRSGPGIEAVLVANRTDGRAAALASEIGAVAVPWTGVAEALAHADVVVSATAAAGAVLDAGVVAAAMARRPEHGLVVVDLALPRDVDPAVGGLAGVTLFDLDDLEASAAAAVAGRRSEIPAAEAIVAEELRRWAGAAAERDVTPVVVALRERAEAIRDAELARLAPRLADLEPSERRAVEALTRGIVAKLLHDPTVNVKAAAGDERGARLAAALAELWGLPAGQE